MKDDPAIERVRETRHEISAECGHDPRKLVAYYLDRQRERRNKERNEAEPKQNA
jgi:hypothetical protein